MEELVVAASLLALFAVGCEVDSKEIGATAGEAEGSETAGPQEGSGTSVGGTSQSGTGMLDSGGEQTDTGNSTTSGVDTGMMQDTTATDTAGEETNGESGLTDPLECAEANTEALCAEAGLDQQACGWFGVSTWVSGLDGACNDIEMDTGYCFTTEQGDDGCGTEFINPTCPDGETIVYFNSVGLEIGAVEIFTEPMSDSTCSGPGAEFLPCEFDGVNFDPPECECGCPG